MKNNTCTKCSRDKKEHYDNLKVPYFVYCFSNSGCFQVESQQIIGISVLLSKVNRCALFSSRRIIGVENGDRETYTERGCLGVPKMK